MKEWAINFWNTQGDRMIFLFFATLFGIGFMLAQDMKGEGKTILIAVATLCLNRARGVMPNGKKPPQ